MEKQISELDENARRKFEQLNNFEQDDITFVTIIIKGYKLNGIENDWNFIQIDIENEMVNFKNTWSTFIKTYEPGLVFRGRFELDIVKFEVLPDKSHKKMLFEDMGIEWAEGDQILNLHVHMIAAKDGLDRKSLLDHAKGRWPHRYGVDVSPLHSNKPKEKNISNLTNYCFKKKTRYVQSGGINSEPTKYGLNYDHDYSDRINNLYDNVNINLQSKRYC